MLREVPMCGRRFYAGLRSAPPPSSSGGRYLSRLLGMLRYLFPQYDMYRDIAVTIRIITIHNHILISLNVSVCLSFCLSVLERLLDQRS